MLAVRILLLSLGLHWVNGHSMQSITRLYLGKTIPKYSVKYSDKQLSRVNVNK